MFGKAKGGSMFKLVKRGAFLCALLSVGLLYGCDDPTPTAPTETAPVATPSAPTNPATPTPPTGDGKPDGVVDDGEPKAKKPHEVLEDGCNAGKPKKCVELGDYYSEWEKNPPKAIAAYKKACDIGYPAGCEKLKGWARMGPDGKVEMIGGGPAGVPSDGAGGAGAAGAAGAADGPPDAASLTRECTSEKNFKSCNELGLTFVSAQNKADRQYAEAHKFFQMACDGGETEGCNNLGYMFDIGDGVEKDHTKAVELYTISCDNSNPDGCAKLGFLLDNGDYKVRNREKAGKILQKACDKGSLIGCTNFGITMVADAGKKIDAKKQFEKACDGGYARGCTMLGLMHSIGDGIPQDHKTANELFDKSCKAGHMGGCVGLGMSYYKGEGFEKDLTKARDWFKVACDGGSRRGCENLGKIPDGDAPAPAPK